MKPLTKETKDKLIAAGREDLIEIHDILMRGKGAINQEGTIVDIDKFPDAIIIPPNNPFLKIHPEEARARARNSN